MRIAVSGTHLSGKTTLVQDLAEALPAYLSVADPARLLKEEGYVFSPVPVLEDFENQLSRSFEALDDNQPDVVFDSCPLDLLAHLLAGEDVKRFDMPAWITEIKASLETIDLLVYVPIEADERIRLSASVDQEMRFDVDDKLRELLMTNPLDLDLELLEVSGVRTERVAQVMRRIQIASAASRLPPV